MDRETQERVRELETELAFLERLAARCPHNPRMLKPLADLYTRVGRIEDGLQVDLELAVLCPEEGGVWYNLGCSYALVDRKQDALAALQRAVTCGYDDGAWMSKDEDLASLHAEPLFAELLEKLGAGPKP